MIPTRPAMHARPKGLGIQLAVWLPLLLSLPTIALAGENETKIPAEGLTRIEVRLMSRGVRVMAWNDDVATISWKRGEKVPVRKDGATLRVGSKSWKAEHGASGDIVVMIPEHIRVDVEVVNGGIEIQGFTGRVRAETMNGEVRVAACSASVDAKTTTGKIHVQDIRGDIVLRTVSGAITGRNLKSTIIETKSVSGSQTLKETHTRQLRMNSHSGSLRFDGRAAEEGMFEGSTFSGDIEFRFSPRDAFDLTAKSRGGRVSVGGGITVIERAKNFVRGSVRQGGMHLSLSSFVGNITVRIAGGNDASNQRRSREW